MSASNSREYRAAVGQDAHTNAVTMIDAPAGFVGKRTNELADLEAVESCLDRMIGSKA